MRLTFLLINFEVSQLANDLWQDENFFNDEPLKLFNSVGETAN